MVNQVLFSDQSLSLQSISPLLTLLASFLEQLPSDILGGSGGLHWVFIAVQGLLPSCGVRASHCGGFSCCRAQALGCTASVVAAHGLSNCDSQSLEHRLNSVAHRFSCSKACGIFLYQVSNLCLLRWQVDSLPLSHQGSTCPLLLFLGGGFTNLVSLSLIPQNLLFALGKTF